MTAVLSKICPECNRVADHEPSAGCLESLDAKYHDHLPYGTNCSLCGVEHAAIWPSAECLRCGDTFDDHRVGGYDHSFRPLPVEDR